jgi:hypothetical protein
VGHKFITADTLIEESGALNKSLLLIQI